MIANRRKPAKTENRDDSWGRTAGGVSSPPVRDYCNGRKGVSLSAHRPIWAPYGEKDVLNSPFRQIPTPSIQNPDWRQFNEKDISGVQIRSRMSFAFRLLRVAIAAAALHLTMASPARACDQMQRAAMPMTHAGHQMPAPTAPSQKHGQQPCCPTMPAGCASAACTIAVVAATTISVSPLTIAVAAPHTAHATRWQSVSSAPEPPPPRA